MKAIFESVINRGSYDLSGLLKKIDSYHIDGKLTDAERDELYARARGGARAEYGVNLWNKMMELESRVKALEGGDTPSQEAEEYVPGKWYYAGNRVTFQGKVYTCIAPEGTVCVWSPADYPAYWQEG